MDSKIAETILKRRPSKQIAGYITEKLFIDFYVQPRNYSYSKGWWSAVEKNKDKDNSDDSNDPGLNHCIEYYKNNNMLIDIAKSIIIEDNFINRYYTTTNIDLIINGKDDEPVCLEIKFKNEFLFKNNGIMEPVFGADVFQYNNVFMPFLESGIKVFNIILYNDVKSEQNKNNTVIFDYLQKKGNDPNKYIWLFKEIHKDETFATHTFTATNTSWSNKNGRTVFCIPKESYGVFSSASNQK